MTKRSRNRITCYPFRIRKGNMVLLHLTHTCDHATSFFYEFTWPCTSLHPVKQGSQVNLPLD